MKIAINQIIYDKYGNSGVVKAVDNDRVLAEMLKTRIFKEGDQYVESAPFRIQEEYSPKDAGIEFFFDLADIGNMERLCDSNGTYAENIMLIEDHYYNELHDKKKILPAGKRIDDKKKQIIINSYYDRKSQEAEEQEFLSKHADCFARIDFDTELTIGHHVKFFRSRHHDICYLTKGKYQRLPDGKQIVNWRSEIADFYYNRDKTHDTSLHYLDVYDNKREEGVEGISYAYDLMLKRNLSARPFRIANLYIGGKQSDVQDEEDTNIYEAGSIDPFLIKIIEEKRLENKLSDIIISIQSNQNRIIRHTNRKNMITQGCAGSGKTMILLHRISYLKYNRILHNPERSVIIVPNQNFSLFIDELAESLELDRIPRLTMRQYYFKLIRAYQDYIDKDLDSSAKALNEIFSSVERQSFMLNNYTSPDEDFSNQFEYEICDLYDSYFENYIIKVKQAEILQIAQRLGIGCNEKKSGYKQLNDLYDLAARGIKGKCEEISTTAKQKLDQYFRIWREYERVIVMLSEFDASLSELLQYVPDDMNLSVKDIVEAINEMKRIIDEIEEISKEIARITSNDQNRNRGFNRLLFGDSRDLKKELERKQNELSILQKRKNTLLNSHIYDIDNESFNKTIEQFEKSRETIGLIKNSPNDRLSSFGEILDVLLKHIQSGGMTIRKGREEIRSRLDEFANSKEVKEAKRTYERFEKEYKEEIAILPNEEELLLLSDAERILRQRRMFVVEMFKTIQGVRIEEISKGHQVFTLLALYCLHVGRMNADREFVFIDEGQDYSESEYRILLATHKQECRFEIYGDVMQCITSNRGVQKWENIKQLFDADYFELEENYRNTVQIAEYINTKVSRIFNPIGFRGPEVKSVSQLDENEYIRNVKEYGHKRIAIIYHDETALDEMGGEALAIAKEKKSLFRTAEAKGLEFDLVYVFTGGMSNNEMYVSFSRALKELVVIHEESSP